ncbi:906_t:CDS:2 [Funneliformis caledonium]|uniref:906_t:CDS:1 n=1 Tax=Funneliformis caledonium TaxID=1117310 RepID=A0A9N9BE27_9GLOM|nr:906_t:CDS:2 [Funneliformis caledonium]
MEKDSQIETCFKGMNLCITALGGREPEAQRDHLDYESVCHYHEGQYANGTTESVTFSQVNAQHDYIGYGYDALSIILINQTILVKHITYDQSHYDPSLYSQEGGEDTVNSNDITNTNSMDIDHNFKFLTISSSIDRRQSMIMLPHLFWSKQTSSEKENNSRINSPAEKDNELNGLENEDQEVNITYGDDIDI